MTRNRSQDAKITGSATGFSLGDLRWLVNVTDDLHEETQVTLYVSQHVNQFDTGYATLSVTDMTTGDGYW